MNFRLRYLFLLLLNVFCFFSVMAVFSPGDSGNLNRAKLDGKNYSKNVTFIRFRQDCNPNNDLYRNAIYLKDGFFLVSCEKDTILTSGNIWDKGKYHPVYRFYGRTKVEIDDQEYYFATVWTETDHGKGLDYFFDDKLLNKDDIFILCGVNNELHILAGPQKVINAQYGNNDAYFLGGSCAKQLEASIRLETTKEICSSLALCSAAIHKENENQVLIGIGIKGLDNNNQSNLFLKLSVLENLINEAKLKLPQRVTEEQLQQNVENNNNNNNNQHVVVFQQEFQIHDDNMADDDSGE